MSGCSLAFTSAPDPSPAAQSASAPRCTTYKVAPILDIIAAMPPAYVTTSGMLLVATENKYAMHNLSFVFGMTGASALLTYAFISSAATGLDNVRRCRRAHRLHQASTQAGPETFGRFEVVGSASKGDAPALSSTR